MPSMHSLPSSLSFLSPPSGTHYCPFPEPFPEHAAPLPPTTLEFAQEAIQYIRTLVEVVGEESTLKKDLHSICTAVNDICTIADCLLVTPLSPPILRQSTSLGALSVPLTQGVNFNYTKACNLGLRWAELSM
ncbi:hypothetical protein B0H13DRAFT_2301159 [Mycena leptocephala]|nr:hypothetical protein B0H13DRAFT_2301159 [Mycena leptocephala]